MASIVKKHEVNRKIMPGLTSVRRLSNSASTTSGRSLVVFIGESAGTSEAEFMFEYNRMSRPCSWFTIYYVLAMISAIAMFYGVLPYNFIEFTDALLTNINSDMLSIAECGTAITKKLVEEVENLDGNEPSVALQESRANICPRTEYTVQNMAIGGLGQAVGSFIGGLLGDLYGRRRVLFWIFGLWTTAVLTLAIPSTALTYQCVYFFLNVAGGGHIVLIYTNLMEISHKKHRFYVMFMPCTVYIALTILAFDFKARFLQWFTCQYMSIFNLFLMAFALWYIPESPRWLMNKGRREEAFQILKDFRMETECQLNSTGEEIVPVTTLQIMKGMWRHLKRRKIKITIVFCILSIVNGILYTLPKWQGIYIEYEKWSSFRFVRMTAWILSIPFTMPIYFAFGLKYGQLFLYVSYGLSSLIMTFVAGGTIILIVYNTFATVFSLSCNVLLYWGVVETIPTFMRATVVAVCYTLFTVVEAMLVITQGVWPYKMTRLAMMIIMCAMSVLGMIVVFLPRSSPKKDLPNHKLVVL